MPKDSARQAENKINPIYFFVPSRSLSLIARRTLLQFPLTDISKKVALRRENEKLLFFSDSFE